MALSSEARFQIARADELLRKREARRQRLVARSRHAAAVLRSDLGATRVWLFGSLNEAWFHEGSDVDIAVEGIAQSRYDEAVSFLETLFGEKVDLVLLDDADAGLADHVRATGEVL